MLLEQVRQQGSRAAPSPAARPSVTDGASGAVTKNPLSAIWPAIAGIRGQRDRAAVVTLIRRPLPILLDPAEFDQQREPKTGADRISIANHPIR